MSGLSCAEDRRIRDFLRRHMLAADCYDWEEQLTRFLEEMASVRNGNPGSVKMIPSWIGTPQPLSEPVAVTAIDIGGTNVRSTVVTVGPDGIIGLDRLPSFPTPGIRESITTDTFFRRIVSRLGHHLETDRIGICFSLAAVPLKNRDAVVTAGAKQLDVTDLIGKQVGRSFQEAAKALGLPHSQQITVINDTTAAALGGRSESRSGGRYSGFVGFIYGTGTNLAYTEPTGEMINVESGSYCGFPCGDIDDRYDAALIDTGLDRFEKMVSGGYQGGLMTCILQTAAEEALLPADFAERMVGVFGTAPVTAKDISSFSVDPAGDNRFSRMCTDGRERQILMSLFDAVTERSAFLCSVTVTGALFRAGIGTDAGAPALITAEGSTYLKQKGFRELLDRCMADHTAAEHRLYYEFRNIPDAVLKGTAVAALSS